MTRLCVAALLLMAAICFGLGITLPIIHVEKLYFFEDTPSLIDIVGEMWEAGNWLIVIAVAGFSILFPLMKLAIVFTTAIAHHAVCWRPFQMVHDGCSACGNRHFCRKDIWPC